jgi:hypothetical protein
MGAVVVALVVALALTGCRHGVEEDAPLLLHEPLFGLACRTGYPCERVGLVVFLADDARSVTALLGGRTVPLRRSARADGADGSPAWETFFRLPRAQELAVRHRRVRVQVRVVAADGSTLSTAVRVPVALGYG